LPSFRSILIKIFIHFINADYWITRAGLPWYSQAYERWLDKEGSCCQQARTHCKPQEDDAGQEGTQVLAPCGLQGEEGFIHAFPQGYDSEEGNAPWQDGEEVFLRTSRYKFSMRKILLSKIIVFIKWILLLLIYMNQLNYV